MSTDVPEGVSRCSLSCRCTRLVNRIRPTQRDGSVRQAIVVLTSYRQKFVFQPSLLLVPFVDFEQTTGAGMTHRPASAINRTLRLG